MGDIEGDAVSDGVELTIDVAVGVADGELVGVAVGEVVDVLVGEFVAVPVGELVGEFVGELVGEFVGESVGEFVGESVGEFVGFLTKLVESATVEQKKGVRAWAHQWPRTATGMLQSPRQETNGEEDDDE